MRTRIGAAVLLAAAVGCATKEGGSGGSGEPTRGSSEPSRDDPAARKKDAAEKLRQIARAMHDYHDVNGHLPVGYTDRSRKKLGLSWRVAILPFIEEGPLFNEFKLEEPWDSEHNLKLVARMPAIYKTGGPADAEGKTHFRGFGGQGALFYTGMGDRPRLTSIQDGSSNTIMVAELAEPVVWTKPDDLDYDCKQPLPKCGGLVENGFLAVMADGNVRLIPKDVPEATLRGMITRSGSEKIWPLPGEEIAVPTPTVVLVLEVRSNEAGNIASMRLRIEDRNIGAMPSRSIDIGTDVDLLKRELATNLDQFKSQHQIVKLQMEVSKDLQWAHAVRLVDLGKQIGFRDITPTLLKD
jgi:hypothetical protein